MPDLDELIENQLKDEDPELLLAAEEERLLEELELLGWLSWAKDDKSHPLRNCDPKFLSSKSFMKKAIEINVKSLKYARDELQKDQDLLLAAIKADPLYYQEIPEEYIKDKKLFYKTARDYLILLLVGVYFSQYGEDFYHKWLKYISPKEGFKPFRNDKDLAELIFDEMKDDIQLHFEYLAFLGTELVKDERFMGAIYRQIARHISDPNAITKYLEYGRENIDLTDDEIEMHLKNINHQIDKIKSENAIKNAYKNRHINMKENE